jgi:hypothetical protein
MTRFDNIGVFIREKVWLENSLSQTFSRINTPTFSNLVIFYTDPPTKMEQTGCSETSTYKIQTLGSYPEESIQHSEHGQSLKSRIIRSCTGQTYTCTHIQTLSPSHTHTTRTHRMQIFQVCLIFFSV